jgi:hypothetical protein
MNGLGLDRRADAMRGGTQSVIGPGNAEGSKLYHRLAGTSVGTQMPQRDRSAPNRSLCSRLGSTRGLSGQTTWPGLGSPLVSGSKPAENSESPVVAVC